MIDIHMEADDHVFDLAEVTCNVTLSIHTESLEEWRRGVEALFSAAKDRAGEPTLDSVDSVTRWASLEILIPGTHTTVGMTVFAPSRSASDEVEAVFYEVKEGHDGAEAEDRA